MLYISELPAISDVIIIITDKQSGRLRDFCRSTLCWNDIYMSVHSSHAGNVPKWLNAGSRKQCRMIDQRL